VNLIKNKGFTIIEAIVSLALFAIAFSGLYFFFGMAHQAYNNSEKRMHLNLMANHILDTIHAEAYRADADVANPFVTPASYNANLSDCSLYTAPDVRHTWCTELDASVGPHKGVHVDEVRTVEVVKDEAYLIADVTLVIDAGIGEKNLIKTFLSRKIPAPRRPGPQQVCMETHNAIIAHVESEIKNCDAGTVPDLTVDWIVNYGGSLGIVDHKQKISCPDWTLLPREDYEGSEYAGFSESGSAMTWLYDFWGRWVNTTFKFYINEEGLPATKPSPYGNNNHSLSMEGWNGIKHGFQIKERYCMSDQEDYLGNIAGNTLDCSQYTKRDPADWAGGKPALHAWSCCPDDSSGPPYNQCVDNWGSTRDPSKYGWTVNVIKW